MPTAQAAAGTDALTAFHWEPQPQAAAFVRRVVDEFLQKLPEAAAFAERLYRETGNRFADLIDTVFLASEDQRVEAALEAGWVEEVAARADSWRLLRHPGGLFPRLAVRSEERFGIDLKVEDLSAFVAANRELHPHEFIQLPDPSLAYRRETVAADAADRTWFGVAERHGWAGVDGGPRYDYAAQRSVYEEFRCRRRHWREDSEDEAFSSLDVLADDAVEKVGRDVACDLFFAAEREYWQRRNAAARFQKARQDALGIGWANHDHHTYRSSRRHFHRLVALWEKLGFECRERFYPGPAAGWGAQVMEQPVCGIVTFNDVDISPDELATDFAHEPMEDRDKLSTVGLWCALHGESVLQAGMHHLECTFDFDALREQMESEAGIATMPKFSDFPHLKQAFTKGERWKVEPARIDALLKKGLITEHQAKEFYQNGAIGSHLENLERNDGFKGFNQTGVTDIIRATDPRRQVQ